MPLRVIYTGRKKDVELTCGSCLTSIRNERINLNERVRIRHNSESIVRPELSLYVRTVRSNAIVTGDIDPQDRKIHARLLIAKPADTEEFDLSLAYAHDITPFE